MSDTRTKRLLHHPGQKRLFADALRARYHQLVAVTRILGAWRWCSPFGTGKDELQSCRRTLDTRLLLDHGTLPRVSRQASNTPRLQLRNNREAAAMTCFPKGFGGCRPDPERIKRDGWRDQGVLVVAEDDARLTWPDRELVRQLGEKLYRPRICEVQHDR